jgi:pimeloyl-ACP methyl ester carboxylesterase
MKFRINGIDCEASLTGPQGAPALALLHGFPFSKELWKSQVPALSREFRVLSYDLRGMGKSSLGKAPQPLESYVDDLLALMDKLRLPQAALCGLSMGGYVALRAVQREPGRFSALALCDSKAEADGNAAKLKRAAGIKALRQDGVRAFAKGMLPSLLSEAGAASEAGKSLLALMCKNKVEGLCNALSAMAGRTDLGEALPSLALPCLVLVGSKDSLTPPELSRAMASAIPGAQCVELPGAGHASNWEQPAAFNQALLDFFRKTLKTGAAA